MVSRPTVLKSLMKSLICSAACYISIYFLIILMMESVEAASFEIPQIQVKTISPGTNVFGSYAHVSRAVFTSLYSVCTMKGELFLSDNRNPALRKVTKDGIVIPVAKLDDDKPFVVAYSVTCDESTGDVYVVAAFSGTPSVLKITSTSTTQFTTVSVTNAKIFFDTKSNILLISDPQMGAVRRVTSEGKDLPTIEVISPYAAIVGNEGNIYITTSVHVIYEYSTTTGNLRMISGIKDTPGYTNGNLVNALWNYPGAIAYDKENSELYVADRANDVIRKIKNDQVTTVVGDGPNHNQVDGLATVVGFSLDMSDIAYETTTKSLYIIESLKLRKFDGVYVTTLINPDLVIDFEGYDVLPEYAVFKNSPELTVDSSGNVFVVNSLDDILKYSKKEKMVTKQLDLNRPHNIAINNVNEMFVGDENCVYKVSPNGELVHYAFEKRFDQQVGGSYGADLVNALYILSAPNDMSVYDDGTILFTETKYNRIRMYNPVSKIVATVLGTGKDGFSPSELSRPSGIVIGQNGDYYFSELGNHIIRKTNVYSSVVSVVAGIPRSFGYSSKSPLESLLNSPGGMFLKGHNLYFCDTGNFIVRVLNTTQNTLRVVAGIPNWYGSDDGPVNIARFEYPVALVVLDNGDIIVADSNIRKISNGTVTTISGKGSGTNRYRDGPLAESLFNYPKQLELLSNGDILVADSDTIRKISNGIVSTLAGKPDTIGYKGENVNAKSAIFNKPSSVRAFGNEIFIADSDNGRIRKIKQDGNIETISGGVGNGLGAKKAHATISEITFDDNNELIVADSNYGIRKVSANGIVTRIVGSGESGMGVLSPDGQNVLTTPLNPINSVAVCSGHLFFIEAVGKMAYLRYVRNNQIFTIAPADHISCDKLSRTLAVSSNNLMYIVQQDFTMKLVSGGDKAPNQDGILNQVKFNNPKFAFASTGELYFTDVKSFKVITCGEGYRIKDLQTCVPLCPSGDNGFCSGNGKCGLDDKCQCNEGYFGIACELKTISNMVAAFQTPGIGLNEKPSISIVINDPQFQTMFQDRTLQISIQYENVATSKVISSSNTVKVTKSFIEINGPIFEGIGEYLASCEIKDTVSGKELAISAFVNQLGQQSREK